MNLTQITQAIATAELDSHLESQAQEIAPEQASITGGLLQCQSSREVLNLGRHATSLNAGNPRTRVAPQDRTHSPVDPIAAQLRSMNRWQVKEDLLRGEIYWQQRQSFKRLKGFKAWLEQQGFAWKSACKYLKLYETFSNFPLEQIEWVDTDTLLTLLQPRYRELLEQLRSLPKWTDSKVQELMKSVREKVSKPKPLAEPGTGWRQLPGGGRGYQLPLLHENWIGTLFEQVREIKNCTAAQLIEKVTLFFVERGQVPGISLKGMQIPSAVTERPALAGGYIIGARGNRQCAHNNRIRNAMLADGTDS